MSKLDDFLLPRKLCLGESAFSSKKSLEMVESLCRRFNKALASFLIGLLPDLLMPGELEFPLSDLLLFDDNFLMLKMGDSGLISPSPV